MFRKILENPTPTRRHTPVNIGIEAARQAAGEGERESLCVMPAAGLWFVRTGARQWNSSGTSGGAPEQPPPGQSAAQRSDDCLLLFWRFLDAIFSSFGRP